MFRISAFKNAEEFNRIFGVETCGNGVVRRKNKILLAFYKSKLVWQYCRVNNMWNLLGITSMAELKNTLLLLITSEYHPSWHHCTLRNMSFRSPKYQVDNLGICLDGTSAEEGFIRYLNMERGGKDYKMAAGKFYNHLITSSNIGQALPQQVVVWLCEQLVEEWKAYVLSTVPEYKLCIGSKESDFERIYDSYFYTGGGFGSCMTCEGYHTFYTDAVTARAAWLEDDNHKIIARCVIYDDVRDEDDNVWRLAERQYCGGGGDLKKRLLVNALIKAGEIDGYKAIGADCGAASAFVDNKGNSLRDKEFSIECNLSRGDTVSYQDSFKWYDMDAGVAYNYYTQGADIDLAITSGRLDGEWDEYHERYVEEVMYVHYEGHEISCDYYGHDDFVQWDDGEWYHRDEMVSCPNCGECFPDPEMYGSLRGVEYSELTEQYYCCCDCVCDAEDDYKDAWWFWSDFEEEYYENRDELTEYLRYNLSRNRYELRTVCKANVMNYIKRKYLTIYNGILVDDDTKLLEDDRACEAMCEIFNELQNN